MKDDYQIIFISGYPHMIGNPVIDAVDYLELKPGDKIVKIGRKTKNGKYSSSCREIEFHLPVEYKGIKKLYDTEYLIFTFHEDYVEKWPDDFEKQTIYLMFVISDGELYLQDHKNQSLMIYKTTFVKQYSLFT